MNCLLRGTDWGLIWSVLRFGHLQHKLIGFYNWDEKCLQRGTDWGFKWSGLCLCHLQHKPIAFYNRDEKCLQRGTDLGFKWSCLLLCHLQHKLIGFYNRDGNFLKRVTKWGVSKHNFLRVFFSPMVLRRDSVPWPLLYGASRSHSDTPHLVRQPVADISTW
jgi:hypothetical protein